MQGEVIFFIRTIGIVEKKKQKCFQVSCVSESFSFFLSPNYISWSNKRYSLCLQTLVFLYIAISVCVICPLRGERILQFLKLVYDGKN